MDHLRTVDFPEGGEGTELQFFNSDMLTLRKKWGGDYLEVVEKGLQISDMEVIELCLAVAARREGKRVRMGLDDVNHVPVSTVADKLLDALSLANNGRTFRDHVEWMKSELEKLGGQGADRPPRTLEGQSPPSTEPPATPESQSPTSGE